MMIRGVLTLILVIFVARGGDCNDGFPISSHTMFPSSFKFGAATASYQVEGGWNADGKGINIWDNMTHEHPEYIDQNNNGDVAANSYYMWKEDVELLKTIGFQIYRFSISWSRVLPTGRINEVNQAGIDYYMNLIDELHANGIEPFVTLYHWDLPQPLEDIGGWLNPEIAYIFADYADLMFDVLSELKRWSHIVRKLSELKKIISRNHKKHVVPQGLRLLANKVRTEYGNPMVIITENGYCDDGSDPLNDIARMRYYEAHLAELRRAIYEDGCNIKGFITWSLIDNLEWRHGYTTKFGIVSVDYNSPSRTRTLKKSAYWFQSYLKMHKLMQ